MTDLARIKQTVLYSFHVAQQANMAEFGGYHMPLWYPSGAKSEHLAVISRAGLFDTSHMAVVTVEGDDAFKLLQHSFSRDLRSCLGREAPLNTGRSVYGLFLNSDGTVLDDAIISQLDKARYMVVVNAGMGGPVSEHLMELAGGEVLITNYSDAIGKIDLQGPAAALIIETLLDDADSILEDMGYFSFKGDIFHTSADSLQVTDGAPIILSRTGYTGEFGFELFTQKEHAAALWQSVLNAGEPFGLIPCGLAARDSLRAGAMLPLSHQDIGDWTFGHTPWSFVLPWYRDGKSFSKSFVGAQQVLQDRHEYTYGYAGYDPRKISAGNSGEVQDEEGTAIGSILTCTTDMAIDRVDGQIFSVATPLDQGRPDSFQPRGLSCGFVRVNRPLQPGNSVWLVEGKRKIKVEIRNSIRPDRTARLPMKRMRSK